MPVSCAGLGDSQVNSRCVSRLVATSSMPRATYQGVRGLEGH